MRARLAAVAVACVAVGVGLLAISSVGATPVVPNARAHAPRSNAQPQVRHDWVRSSLRPSDINGGDAVGYFTNLTPYTMTFVESGSYPDPLCKACSRWVGAFPVTLKPGERFLYRLGPTNSYKTTERYDGFFTYRVDTLTHPEYLSLSLVGSRCSGICLASDGPSLATQVIDGTGAPTIGQDSVIRFGPSTPSPEIGWTGSGVAPVWTDIFGRTAASATFDYTFQTKGNYTLDASKAPPQLADLLNAMCAGVKGTSCSFTQTGPIQWGIGKLDSQALVKSCGPEPPTAAVKRVRSTAPADSPDWHEVSVEAARTRSVSVGGSLTASTELDLFETIDVEVSATVGAEHEWGDTRTFEKTTRVYVPQDWVAGMWIAPVLGKVTGTLVVSTGVATYTITNFEETASGVSKDLKTPAFNIITNSRPMTSDEYQRLCPKQTHLGAPPPPVGLG